MDLNNVKLEYDDLIWGDKFSSDISDFCKFYKIDDLHEKNSFELKKVFISHNGDLPANETVWQKISQYSNFWYSTNVTFKNDRVKPIPIGLENDYVTNSIHKKNCLYRMITEDINPSKLLYVNHNIGTNPSERAQPYTLFSNNEEVTVHNHSSSISIESYYSEIKNHFFVLSPPGNGIDAHRSWEILYLGRVPIIKDIYHDDLFSDLPVVKYSDYTQITPEFLKEQRRKILENYSTYNFDKLKISYWIDTIKNNL